MKLSTSERSASGMFNAIARAFPAPQFLLPHACGVDISDASIKWMTLSRGEPLKRRVLAWGELPIAPGIVGGGIVHDVAGLASALKEIAPRMGGINRAHAALPEEAAYVFGMRVPPRASREQALSMIEFEFNDRVPIAPAQAVYDFSVIGEDPQGEEIGVSVFPAELAAAYAESFSRAGIELLSLEVEASSIARATLSDSPEAPITLLVDFGRARTGIAVVKRGVPIFTSTVDVGGDALSAAAVKLLSLSPEAAQTFRNTQGLAPAGPGKKPSEAMAGVASALADEIARFYQYWDTRRSDSGQRLTPVGEIVLVGGSANLRGLPGYVATRVQAPASLGSIWRHVCDTEEYIPPIDARASLQFATAAGLALRGM